tara:strand:- start:2865 stop:3071 length:207 start_codon:yes stop_codon:yes gene_type:complete
VAYKTKLKLGVKNGNDSKFSDMGDNHSNRGLIDCRLNAHTERRCLDRQTLQIGGLGRFKHRPRKGEVA